MKNRKIPKERSEKKRRFMSQTLRHPEIIAIARRAGKVTVEGLVTHFGVTPQTIRKDLSDLADAGQLERVHGGAILPSGTRNIVYEERRALNAEGKARIAKAVADEVPNDCALFLGIGTTTEAVAAALLAHSGLLVVTNNIHIADILAPNDAIEVIVTAGHLRAADGGLVGALTRESVEKFSFDFGVVGCSALTEGGGMLDFDLREVEVSQAVIGVSRKVFLVADQSKFERTAPARIGAVGEVDVMFTDARVPRLFAVACGQNNTRLSVHS